MSAAEQPLPLFAAAVERYRDAGWEGVLPIPARKKSSPPSGFTGDSGAYPTEVQLSAWARGAPDANIALRMPPDVIGIDVDAYGDKPGGRTLAALEAQLGPLPYTWTSTSRHDGVSGIRLYKIPPGVKLVGSLPGIEIIQRHHRYAVVAPSIHPDGREYRWIDPDGVEGSDVAYREDVPDLPPAWLEHLRADRHTTAERRVLATGQQEPSRAVDSALGGAMRRLTVGTRHDGALSGVTALTRLAHEGHPGADDAIATLQRAFLAAVAADGSRNEREAAAEWQRMVDSAEQLVTTTPSTRPSWDELTAQKIDPFAGILPAGTVTTPSPTQTPERPPEGEEDPDGDPAPDEGDPTIDGDDWEPADIRGALDVGLVSPRPTILRPIDTDLGLIYEGRVNMIFGESGAGKTWLALAAVAEAIRDGLHTVIIDLEDSLVGTLTRLRALGLTDDQLVNQLSYIAPDTAWGVRGATVLARIMAAHDVALVVIDSVGEAMAAAGVKGNNDDEVAEWMKNFPRAISVRGPGVLLLDHVPKDANAPAGYSIGSQRKRAAVTGASYRVDAIKVPSRSDDGILEITAAKDRWGHHTQGRKVATVRVTHGLGNLLSVTLLAPEGMPKAPDGEDRPTELMEQVSRYLETNPRATTNAIKTVVGGKAQYVAQAIRRLVVEGYVLQEGGPNRSHLHSSIEAFRKPGGDLDGLIAPASNPVDNPVDNPGSLGESRVSPGESPSPGNHPVPVSPVPPPPVGGGTHQRDPQEPTSSVGWVPDSPEGSLDEEALEDMRRHRP
ncbi:MAG TPA: bifunctional DNA primase/polymerase [Aquihabitans sp.]|nr:bifunctional DNA primase/polymerase [Aquihabitans sp.]